MQCQYCQKWNEDEERRCARCGRRLHDPSREIYPVMTAAAPALEALQGGNPQAGSAPTENVSGPPSVSYQASLFRDASGGPKVIPIPMLTPSRSSAEPSTVRRPTRPRRVTPRRAAGSSSQQSLDFYDPYGNSAAASVPAMDAGIYCDAPVALPSHRIIAAAFDGGLVMVALGVVMAIFFFSGGGGDIVLSRANVPVLLGVGVVLALFYRALWCLADGDTPGMRFAGLKLVDFDGRPPDREQRGLRQVASVLSIVSAGLGLVWALVDEENLAWHDHISKTFPTPM